MELMGWKKKKVFPIYLNQELGSVRGDGGAGGGDEIKLSAFAIRRQQLRLCQRSRLI